MNHHHSHDNAHDSHVSRSQPIQHQRSGTPMRPDDVSTQHGHDKHAGHSVAMFRRKFWAALILTVPALIWGHMLPNAVGYTPPYLPGSHFFPAIFGSIVFFVGGLVFLQGAVRELHESLPGMMTLIGRSEERRVGKECICGG